MSNPADWLYFAREDIRVAELTFKHQIYNQTCFHAQQCCEKALKAWLIHQGIDPPKKHQLALLLSLSPVEIFDELRKGIVSLDRFYIPVRYPDAIIGSLPEGLPGKLDAQEAIETARRTLRRVEENIPDIPPS